MTKIEELIDRIDILDPTSENIDSETNKKYFSIVKDDFNLLNDVILKTGLTEPRRKMFRMIMLILGIFTGKKYTLEDHYEDVADSEKESEDELYTETNVEDIKDLPELETEEQAEKRQKGQGLKIMTPSQLITRLPILLAEKQAGNTSNKLKSEIRQIIYSLYR